MSSILDKMKGNGSVPETTGAGIKVAYYQERLGLLYQVAEKASSVSQVSLLLDEILSITQKILRASASSLFLIDQEENKFYVQAAGGEAATVLKQMKLDLSAGIVGWVAGHGTSLLVGDAATDDRFNKEIDRSTGFVTKTVLAAPLVRGRKVIGVLEVLNKTDGTPFNVEDLVVLNGLAQTEALILLVSMAATALTNIRLSQNVLDGYKDTVENLVAAADARDPYAWGHSQRVKDYTIMAARSLSVSAEQMRLLEFGALLHDIGKIGISENILRKSGPLSFEELHIIHKHPLRGANILGEIPHLEKAREIVLSHHERYDGTGYPENLKGDSIPLGARLVAVADAFDTMTTDHSYRTALGVDEAMNELIKGMRTQFCPLAVKAFISGFKKHAETQAKIEAKEIKKFQVSEKQSKKEAEGARKNDKKDVIELTARHEAEPVVAPVASVADTKVREKAEAVKEKVKGNDVGAEIFEGEVQVVVPWPATFEMVKQFHDCLKKVDNVNIVMVGGSVDQGAQFVLSVPVPMPLGEMLKQIPMVDTVGKADKKSKKLAVILKSLPAN